MSSLHLALFSLLVSTAFSLPTSRRFSARSNDALKRRGTVNGSVGLGDNSDLLYTVPIQLGDTTTIVNLDTGSSDLWVISSACTKDACAKARTNPVPAASLKVTGANVTMRYGDSTTGTFASGPIAQDTVAIAGVAIDNQLFAAISDTTNTVVEFGAAGIFGLGFPTESQIMGAQVTHQFGGTSPTDHFVAASYADGPLISRIAQSGALEMPMFSISLQRSTIDISGSGALTLGSLPPGVDNSSITWVPVRLYSPAEGGINPPSFAPNEVYPLRWEIDLDAVFLDGTELPRSSVPASGGVNATRMSALIDTGNSILRGPSDTVNTILSTISSDYDGTDSSTATLACAKAHNLTFQIGGKLFPIDPRDLISAEAAGDATNCVADNIVSTDAPGVGALFRWSLGDPFMKSNLVVFHYGNLTNPSQDPPRIGFVSQVPADAAQQLSNAVASAQANGGNFQTTIEIAPTADVENEPEVTVTAVSASEQAAALTGTHAAPAPTNAPAGAAGAAGAAAGAQTTQVNVGQTVAAAAPTASPKPKSGAAAPIRAPWVLALAAAALGAVVTGW